MVYTLGTAALPNATWGVYFNALGQIQRETVRKSTFIQAVPLFGSDSSNTDVWDYGGVVRRITLEVKKIDTSANLATFVAALYTLANGDQSTDNNYPVNFTSDMLGANIKVKFETIDHTWVAGSPTILNYTIVMIESSTMI